MHQKKVNICDICVPKTVKRSRVDEKVCICMQCVAMALQKHIGKICHVYLDDIIIWSQDIDEHIRNVCTIMNALRDAKLYINCKKMELFC